jgi:hypothetical protein
MASLRFAKIAVWPLLAIAVGSLAFVACGSDMQEFNDAGRLANNDAKAITISMPDGFTNVAAKCVGPDLLYAAINTNGRAIAVSPQHPWCEDWVLTKDETER